MNHHTHFQKHNKKNVNTPKDVFFTSECFDTTYIIKEKHISSRGETVAALSQRREQELVTMLKTHTVIEFVQGRGEALEDLGAWLT